MVVRDPDGRHGVGTMRVQTWNALFINFLRILEKLRVVSQVS